jgi:hypothetical protein
MVNDLTKPVRTAQEIVDAVRRDEFVFITFKEFGKAYWIGGRQAIATAFSASVDHCSDIRVNDKGWLEMTALFRSGMVPQDAWLKPPDGRDIVPVTLTIDPATIDFKCINRGFPETEPPKRDEVAESKRQAMLERAKHEAREKREKNEKRKLCRLMPMKTFDIPKNLRRHLRTLEKADALRFEEATGTWHLTD